MKCLCLRKELYIFRSQRWNQFVNSLKYVLNELSLKLSVPIHNKSKTTKQNAYILYSCWCKQTQARLAYTKYGTYNLTNTTSKLKGMMQYEEKNKENNIKYSKQDLKTGVSMPNLDLPQWSCKS